MKLEQWASIAEIVGSFAVVVTLVVLLVEVRGNTAAVQAATYNNVVESITTTLNERGADADLTRIWLAGNAREPLEPIDQDRYESLVGANMRRFENAFYQYQIGGIEESQWEPIKNIIAFLMSSSGHRLWWSNTRTLYSAEFQDLVDSLEAAEN